MSARSLYVGVVDDGTKRDGFAQYVCLKAGEFDIEVELVKVVDISTLVKTGKFKELGRSFC